MEPPTFYRYLNAVFEDDRRSIAEIIGDDEIPKQLAIWEDGLLALCLRLIKMIRDPNVKIDVKNSAHYLSAEISAAILKI